MFFFLVVAQFYKLVILFFVCFFCNLSFTSGFPTLWRTSWDKKKKKKKSKRHQTSCTKRGDFKFRLSKPSTSSFQPQRHNQGRDSDLWHFFKLALKTFFPLRHRTTNTLDWMLYPGLEKRYNWLFFPRPVPLNPRFVTSVFLCLRSNIQFVPTKRHKLKRPSRRTTFLKRCYETYIYLSYHIKLIQQVCVEGQTTQPRSWATRTTVPLRFVPIATD